MKKSKNQTTAFNLVIKSYVFDHGIVEGAFVKVPESQDLVIITNGHNGFYSYGMFPAIQQGLAEAGISSFSYNFSHGGTRGQEDVFTDLDAYAKNCMRLEVADLVAVCKAMHTAYPNQRVWLLGHSMGSIPTIFGARALNTGGGSLAGMILLAPVSRLDFWPEELIREWAKTGTIQMFNKRTGQHLPHGPELLSEIQLASTLWNTRLALKSMFLPLVVIHGGADESVGPEHGQKLVEWVNEEDTNARLVIIPDAGHTFGTRHPFEGNTAALNRVIEEISQTIHHKGNPSITRP